MNRQCLFGVVFVSFIASQAVADQTKVAFWENTDGTITLVNNGDCPIYKGRLWTLPPDKGDVGTALSRLGAGLFGVSSYSYSFGKVPSPRVKFDNVVVAGICSLLNENSSLTDAGLDPENAAQRMFGLDMATVKADVCPAAITITKRDMTNDSGERLSSDVDVGHYVVSGVSCGEKFKITADEGKTHGVKEGSLEFK